MKNDKMENQKSLSNHAYIYIVWIITKLYIISSGTHVSPSSLRRLRRLRRRAFSQTRLLRRL